jgi:hypothetical protein
MRMNVLGCQYHGGDSLDAAAAYDDFGISGGIDGRIGNGDGEVVAF